MKLSHLIISAVVSLGVSTPALANHYNYPYNRGYDNGYRQGEHRGYDRGWRDGRYRDREYRNDNPERVIVPLIGGIVLGAIIANSNKRDRDEDIVYRQPAPRRYVYDYRCDCYR